MRNCYCGYRIYFGENLEKCCCHTPSFSALEARKATKIGRENVFQENLSHHLSLIELRCGKGKNTLYKYYFKFDHNPIPVHMELEKLGFVVEQVPNKNDGLEGKTFKISW